MELYIDEVNDRRVVANIIRNNGYEVTTNDENPIMEIEQ